MFMTLLYLFMEEITNNLTSTIKQIQQIDEDMQMHKNLMTRLEQNKTELLELKKHQEEKMEQIIKEREQSEKERKEKKKRIFLQWEYLMIELMKKNHLEEINAEYPDLEEKQNVIFTKFMQKIQILRDNESLRTNFCEQIKTHKMYHIEFGPYKEAANFGQCSYNILNKEYLILINIYGECYACIQINTDKSYGDWCNWNYSFDVFDENKIRKIVKKNILESLTCKKIFDENLNGTHISQLNNINLVNKINFEKKIRDTKNKIYKCSFSKLSTKDLFIIQQALLQELPSKYPFHRDAMLSNFNKFKIVAIIHDKEGPINSTYETRPWPGQVNFRSNNCV